MSVDPVCSRELQRKRPVRQERKATQGLHVVAASLTIPERKVTSQQQQDLEANRALHQQMAMEGQAHKLWVRLHQINQHLPQNGQRPLAASPPTCVRISGGGRKRQRPT